MGANEESAATEQPQLGLLDQWLAHHREGEESSAPERRRATTDAERSTAGAEPLAPSPAAPPSPEITSAKDRLAAARREKENREASTPPAPRQEQRAAVARARRPPAEPPSGPGMTPEPDPVLLAKLAALRAEAPAGGPKDRLAAKRAEHQDARRDVGAEILGALGAAPPEPPAAPVAAAPAEPAEPADPPAATVTAPERAPAPEGPAIRPDEQKQAPDLSASEVAPAAEQAITSAHATPPTAPSPGMPDAEARRARLARMVGRRHQAVPDAATPPAVPDATPETPAVEGVAADDTATQEAAAEHPPATDAAAEKSAPAAAEEPAPVPAAASEPVPSAVEPADLSPRAMPEAAVDEAAAEPATDDAIDEPTIDAAAESTPRETARRSNGRHKADIPSPPPVEEVDGTIDPALHGALRAVEAAEAAASAAKPDKSRWRRRSVERTAVTPEPPSDRADAPPAFPPAPEPTTITESEQVIPLDPTVAAGLEAGIASRTDGTRTEGRSGRGKSSKPAPAVEEADAEDLLMLVTRSADEARARRASADQAAPDPVDPEQADTGVTEAPTTPTRPTHDPVRVSTPRPATPAPVDPAPVDPAPVADETVATDPVGPEPGDEPAELAQTTEPDVPPPVEPLVAAEAAIAKATRDVRRPAAPTASAAVAAEQRPRRNPTARPAATVVHKEDPGVRHPRRPETEAPTSPKAPPGVVRFSPRRSTRKLLGMLLLLCIAGAIGTGLLAYETRGTPEIAIAGTLGLMTLILWSAFSTAEPAKLSIDRGVLDIVSKESRHRFDLSSPYTETTVVGSPGKRGWQVQIHRRSMRPFVIDSSMVDPEEFQPVLEYYREVAEELAEENERRRGG